MFGVIASGTRSCGDGGKERVDTSSSSMLAKRMSAGCTYCS